MRDVGAPAEIDRQSAEERPPHGAPPQGARPFDAAPPPDRPAARPGGRSRTLGLIAALTAIVALSLGGHQLVASAAHAQAWPLWAAADARFDEAVDAHALRLDRGGSAIARAEALQQVLTTELVHEDDRAALEASLVAARTALTGEPEQTTGLILLTDPSAPAPAWDRYADLWRLAELVPARNESADRLEASADAVAEATREVTDAAEELVAGSRELAAAELAAHPSATYRTRLALQGIIDGTHTSGIPSTSAAGFTELATAVDEVRASHAAEEARRLEYPVRSEVEAFARSIAFGVTLDFVWAYEVAGVTSDAWYAGTAEFWEDGGGWGHITLSESISDAWGGDENARAIVVHEVGHTQVVRDACRAIFDGPAFEGDHETWATAWAIGMGYDLPGAGIEAYGRPSSEQIDAASGCR